MNPLAPADVAKLRCRFIWELYNYLKCNKYSINCCPDEAITSYLNYKLASNTCELPEDVICYLNNYNKKSFLITCGEDVPCAAQAEIDFKITVSGEIYTPTFLDFSTSEVVQTIKPRVVLVPDSIYHDAWVQVGFRDQYLQQYYLSDVFSTGKAKVGMSIVTSPILYSLKAQTQMSIDNVSNLAGGYLKTVRVYFTNALGQFDPTFFQDIDVSPTSFYRTCGTCNPVATADLEFTSNNWSDAVKTMLDNAVRVITGSSTNANFTVSKAVNLNRISLLSLVKHAPSSVWAGLRHKDFRVEYFNGTSSVVVTSSSSHPTFFGSNASNMYGTSTFTFPCGNKTIEVANTQLAISVNWAASEFNNIVLLDSQTLNTVTIVDKTPIDCTTTTVTPLINTNEVIVLVEWLNSSNVVLATGFSFSPPSAGNYTARVTLGTGCVLTQPFSII